jgi:hypothetical protein
VLLHTGTAVPDNVFAILQVPIFYEDGGTKGRSIFYLFALHGCSAVPLRSPAGRSRSCSFLLLRRSRRNHPAGSRRVFQLEAVIHRYAEGVLGELMVYRCKVLFVCPYCTVPLHWTPGRFASGILYSLSSHLDFWHVTGTYNMVACSLVCTGPPAQLVLLTTRLLQRPACFTHNTTAATTVLFYSQHCP